MFDVVYVTYLFSGNIPIRGLIYGGLYGFTAGLFIDGYFWSGMGVLFMQNLSNKFIVEYHFCI